MESTDPIYVQDWEYCSSVFEDTEDYTPGGLHPTHLGDLLGGRYKVVLKLGHGGFGMVWLCRDTQENKWRAVKILRASASTEDCADLRVHSVFSDMDSRSTDISHSRIAFALNHFWLDGPNGTHLCIVLPLLGPNLENAAERHQYEEAPLMRICYQLVQAMRFLHTEGVCHGDFRPQNVCYTLKDIDDLEEDDIMRAFGRPKLMTLVDDAEFEGESGFDGAVGCSDGEVYEDGTSDGGDMDVDTADHDEESEGHLPRYLVVPSYIEPNSAYVSNNIAVIDFGESFFASAPPEQTGIPPHYGAPETFLDKCGDLGFASDLWALACTICYVRVRCEPFLDIGDFWSLMTHWENLNGPLPEPYRSSLAESFEIPDDPEQYVSTDSEEREEAKKEHLRRTRVTGSLHNILLIERRFHVPLQEGEEPSPPPPRTSSTRGSMLDVDGHKIVAFEMSRRKASDLMDLFKRMFA
jgi:serine/threonine protein kinase